MKTIKISVTQSNILVAVISTLGGLGLMTLIYFFNHRESGFFFIAILFILFRIFIYQNLDLWFSKNFFKADGFIKLRCAGIDFRLDPERSFLRIDSNLNLSRTQAKHPTLNIYRNPSNVLFRLFKNKIKLKVPDKKDLSDCVVLAREISEKLEIRFMDNYTEGI